MEATASSTTSKKKTPKGTFHGPADGSFSQKKKVVLDNVKHSGDERDISLSRSGSGDNVYSNVKSLFGEDENVSMSGIDGGSLLGSAATTPKVKQVNTGAVFGSPLGSPDFYMDDDEVIDPKIIKTPVEVSIKKSFALNINLLAVENKSATAKTQLIRKNFSLVNSFGESMEMATLLAREKRININSNLRKQEIRSDWAVVIKEIPMNTPKDIIVTAVSKFEEIKSIKIQLIGMWQKTVVEFVELDYADLLAFK
ncbi:hypothetical protein G9A89_020511 [Geosiphon pyriformis]|nr:hypothetical protein G9A89_020511 [Geosiphon pyriformis]